MARPSSDEAVERLLRRSLTAHGATAGEVCPDSDLLAAFAEGGLNRTDALQIERHASSCARCTQIIAVVLRSAPPVASAPVSGLTSAWRAWRWAVPLATAATVAGLWFVSTPSDTPRGDTPPSSVVARGPEPPRQAPPGQPSPVAPPVLTGETSRKAPQDERAQRQRADADIAPSENRAELDKSPDLQRRALEAPARETAALSQPAASKAEAAAAAPASALDSAAAARSQTFAAAPPPVPSPAGPVQTTRSALESARQVNEPFALQSADPNTLWRVSGTTIERSLDKGRSWIVEYIADRPITGGVALASDVAWCFGRAGLLLRRTPAGWSVVRSPDGADVATIEATSAISATLTLADGRVFATTDGGMTWTRR